MKRVVLCLSFCGLLGGCAALSRSGESSQMVVDSGRVAAIERAASRSGVSVIWLTMPTKRVTSGG
jgi:hypothetical protein